MKRLSMIAAATAASALVLAGCSSPSPDTTSNGGTNNQFTYDAGHCQTFDVASSPEKVSMMNELAQAFKQESEKQNPDNCYAPKVFSVSSGDAATYLEKGWDKQDADTGRDVTTLPLPTMWSPASSLWVDYVQSSTDKLVDDWKSFAHTPVVVAMPEQMARQLGWPNKPVGMQDLHDVCLSGWGVFGGAAATWGDFKFSKTHPVSSTTGLNMLLAQAYTASGKKADLTVKDIVSSSKFSKDIESCVTHYGDTTGAVLQRIADISAKGSALAYTSAVAVEEKSVIDFNLGNPNGNVITDPSQLQKPAEKLVAIYPKEGSLESDNPAVILGESATWVTPEQRAGAEKFAAYLQSNAVQSKLADYGFRPLDNSKPLAGLFTAENGVNAKLPAVYLPKPKADVVDAAIQQWQKERKASNVMLLVDGSGSMNDRPDGVKVSYLQGVKEASHDAIALLRTTDRLGVNVFWDDQMASVRDLSPIGNDLESGSLQKTINGIAANGGTPLYDSVWATYQAMKAQAEPGRINAIVLLSDGEDAKSNIRNIGQLVEKIRNDIGENANRAGQVMIFPLNYGKSAPTEELQQLAEVTGGQVIDVRDASLISEKLKKAFRNF